MTVQKKETKKESKDKGKDKKKNKEKKSKDGKKKDKKEKEKKKKTTSISGGVASLSKEGLMDKKDKKKKEKTPKAATSTTSELEKRKKSSTSSLQPPSQQEKKKEQSRLDKEKIATRVKTPMKSPKKGSEKGVVKVKEEKKEKKVGTLMKSPKKSSEEAKMEQKKEPKKEAKKEEKKKEKVVPVTSTKVSPCNAIEIPLFPEVPPKIEPLPPGKEPNPPLEKNKEPKDLYGILNDISEISKSMTGSAERTKSDPPKPTVGVPLEKSSSLELKKTQSLSDRSSRRTPLDAPIVPGPPSKVLKVNESKENPNDKEWPMLTPPKSDKSEKARQGQALRSELDMPMLEQGFVQHHGNTIVANGMPVTPFTKVDLDLIGRTGMYLERFGMSVERKAAFDWIAYNRHDLNNKDGQFNQCLSNALGDIGIMKPLLLRTLSIFKSQGQITKSEHDHVLEKVQKLKEDLISFAQVSALLRQHCAFYRNFTSASK